MLDDGDTAALALLPGDPAGAAAGFGAGFEPLVELFRDAPLGEVVGAFHDLLSPRDRELMADQRRAAAVGESMKESLRQGATGGGWDNVAWVGPWGVDPTTISRPVFLWYGDEDRFAPLAHGEWLRDNVPGAQYVLRKGEGHLGFMEHTAEMFSALTGRSD
jgi:pimeloyl-ACP methyl ester carboxylesterase